MKKNKINVDLLLKNERSTIDRLDSIIVSALIERFVVTKKIGLIKAKNKIKTYDNVRESEQIKRLEKMVEGSELDIEFIRKFMKLITSESKKRHERIKRKTIGD